MPSIDATSDDLDTLVRTMCGEADNQGPDGLAAVCWTIKNRLAFNAWWGGSSIKAVCLHQGQFSCWNPGPDRERIEKIDEFSDHYAAVLKIAQMILDGAWPDPTRGSTTYKVMGTHASWDAAVQALKPISIGAHDFWRLAPNGDLLPFMVDPGANSEGDLS